VAFQFERKRNDQLIQVILVPAEGQKTFFTLDTYQEIETKRIGKESWVNSAAITEALAQMSMTNGAQTGLPVLSKPNNTTTTTTTSPSIEMMEEDTETTFSRLNFHF
jgi:hypothetical protein